MTQAAEKNRLARIVLALDLGMGFVLTACGVRPTPTVEPTPKPDPDRVAYCDPEKTREYILADFDYYPTQIEKTSIFVSQSSRFTEDGHITKDMTVDIIPDITALSKTELQVLVSAIDSRNLQVADFVLEHLREEGKASQQVQELPAPGAAITFHISENITFKVSTCEVVVTDGEGNEIATYQLRFEDQTVFPTPTPTPTPVMQDDDFDPGINPPSG